jgi:LmeA-like phospholipid-binding
MITDSAGQRGLLRHPSKVRAALRRHRAAAIAASVALVAVVAAGTGEFTARNIIQSRIAKAVPALGSVAVSESGSALWDVMNKHISSVNITSSNAHFGPLSQVSVQARLDNVRLGGKAMMSGAHAEFTIPAQSIGDAVQAAVPSIPVASVATDPASGMIAVAVGPGGIGQLMLHPVITGGKLSLPVAGLAVMGRSLPPGSLGKAGRGLGPVSGVQRAYPLGLKATSLQVLPDGLQVTLSGGPGILGSGGHPPAR